MKSDRECRRSPRLWVCMTVVFCSLEAGAQSYPVKPIYIVLGNAPGGGADTVARLLAPKLSQQLGQPVIVENRTGAATSIATERVAKSPADGYTLFMATSTAFILPALRPSLPWNLERDFAPISLVANGALVLVVHPAVPARNVKELISLARSRPGQLNYGSSGVGSLAHLAGELFNLLAQVRLVHVPYKGSAEATIANATGEIEINFPSDTAAVPLMAANKVRALAVTSSKRSSFMPSTPTLDESGLPGYVSATYFGLLAPVGISKDIVVQLNTVVERVINATEMKEAINQQGLQPQASTPEQFTQLIRRELAQNAKLVKLAGLKDE